MMLPGSRENKKEADERRNERQLFFSMRLCFSLLWREHGGRVASESDVRDVIAV